MQRFINNWAATLTAPAASGGLILSIDPVEAAKLVGLGSGDYYLLTLAEVVDDVETSWEIVKVTAAVGGSLTVEREQEGTGPAAWSVGAQISARATAGSLEALRGVTGPAGASAYQVAVANGFTGSEAQWLESLQGPDGADGSAGASAYQVALANGFVGTETEWIASLVGSAGADGADGAVGLSAYQVALANGFVGTEPEWLESLEGAPGAAGAGLNIVGELPSSGDLPGTGSPGEGYIIADHLWLWVDGAWLNTGPIRGPQGESGADGGPGDPGPAGASAYQVAVANGFVGTEAAWLASLQGAPGGDGADGAPGTDGADGLSAYEVALASGFVGTEAQWLESLIGDQGPPGATALNRLNISNKSADYTFVLADAEGGFLHPSADTTARAWTIPANASVAYDIGTALTFINQASAGTLTIAITSDTMRLAGAGTTGSRTLAANGVATALKITSTEWLISGVNLA